MGQVLGIVYRAIARHLAHKAGYTKSVAHTRNGTTHGLLARKLANRPHLLACAGAVTLI